VLEYVLVRFGAVPLQTPLATAVAPTSLASPTQSSVPSVTGVIHDIRTLQMVLLEIGDRLHFDQPPAIVSPTLQDIHPHEHVAVFERGFEDRRDFSVRD
jgi:hypothetical protein